MLGILYNKIKLLYNKKVSGYGLAIFRIVYCAILLCEVAYLFYFRHLVFDKIPFVIPGEIEMWPILIFWMISIVFIIFGLFTRVAAIINYILTVSIIGTISSFEYHMFYSYLGMNFLLIFLPINRCISIDRLVLKLKYSNTRFLYNPPTSVSVLSYYIPILIGIAFVYFDSVFFKLTSDIWMNGLGLWLPASMPQAVFIDTTFLLNQKYLVLGLGYLTLFFEAVFLFTFWRKKFRTPLLIVGVGLHLGILVCFPIPFFALGVVALYLLMVPVGFWENIVKKHINSRNKYVTFYYDMECPLCNRTRIILSHLDIRHRIEFKSVQLHAESEPALHGIPMDRLFEDIHSVDKTRKVYIGLDTYLRVFNAIFYLKPIAWLLRIPGIYYLGKKFYRLIARNRITERCTEEACGYTPPRIPTDDDKIKILADFTLAEFKAFVCFNALMIAVLFQLIVTYNSPLITNFRIATGIENTAPARFISSGMNKIQLLTKVFFGVTHHGVFMDSHFDGYNHSISILYKSPNGNKIWLPITSSKGTSGDYLFGFNWVKWTFRVNAPSVDQEKLKIGIRDFTAFWAKKNGISLKNASFEIRVKKIRVPQKWEEDFFRKQIRNPWVVAGEVFWRDEKFEAKLRDIEKM